MNLNRMTFLCIFLAVGLGGGPVGPVTALAGELDPAQQKWYEKYKVQLNAPDPAAMQLNTDPEPDLTQEGMVNLFNGRDLAGWTVYSGNGLFEVQGEEVVGRSRASTRDSFLCTDDDTWSDLLLTCETFWEVDGNTGIMFRARTRPHEGAGENPAPQDLVVYGPQIEMEGFDGFAKGRGWSGAAYGEGCGGYFYPLWLKEHAAARAALKRGEWNRMTLLARGNVVRTWINGVPAAHWIGDGSFPSGRLGLQLKGKGRGTIRWRHFKVKRLPPNEPAEPAPLTEPAAGR